MSIHTQSQMASLNLVGIDPFQVKKGKNSNVYFSISFSVQINPTTNVLKVFTNNQFYPLCADGDVLKNLRPLGNYVCSTVGLG